MLSRLEAPRYPPPSDKPPQVNKIGQFFKLLKFPSTLDAIINQTNLYLPSVLGVLFSLLWINTTSTLAKADSIPLDSAFTIYKDSYLFLASIGFQAATDALIIWQYLRSHHNYEYLSNLLCFNKVAMSPKNYLSLTFPEVQEFPFYGELHLTERTDKYRWILTNPYAAFRDAFTGLANLADACEHNDPRLDGIQFFGGISSIIDTRLTRFGFHVAEPVVDISPIERLYEVFLNLFPDRSLSQDNPDQSPVMACYITRENLIANKGNFARFAKHT